MTLTAIAGLGILAGQSQAASSDWAHSEGGAIRLVTTGAVDASGALQGMLEIQLKPGWKTYWRDPGSSGVAPSLDLGGAGAVETQYPAPGWHNDGQYDWAGYEQPVAFPVTLNLKQSGPVEATAFLGVCETICIPFQATLKLDPAVSADDAVDKALVESARAALPKPATTSFGVEPGTVNGDHLELRFVLPDSNGAQLFLAGADGYQFGKPALQPDNASFSAKILTRPATKPDGAGIHYTLVSGKGEAVSGVIPYF